MRKGILIESLALKSITGKFICWRLLVPSGGLLLLSIDVPISRDGIVNALPTEYSV